MSHVSQSALQAAPTVPAQMSLAGHELSFIARTPQAVERRKMLRTAAATYTADLLPLTDQEIDAAKMVLLTKSAVPQVTTPTTSKAWGNLGFSSERLTRVLGSVYSYKVGKIKQEEVKSLAYILDNRYPNHGFSQDYEHIMYVLEMCKPGNAAESNIVGSEQEMHLYRARIAKSLYSFLNDLRILLK